MPVDPSARIAPAYFSQGYPLAYRAYVGLDAADLPRMGGLRGQEEVQAARLWADRINAKRTHARADTPPAKAGELMAMALLGEILRFVADSYAVQYNPGVLARGRAYAAQSIGVPLAIEAEDTFATLFPPAETLDEPELLPEYLRGTGLQLSNRDLIVRESVLLTVQNGNPAVRGYRSLFDDMELIHKPSYRRYAPTIESFLRKEPPHPETGMNLIETLWAPILANPDDIEAQLGYVRKQWGRWLPEALLETLLLAGGMLREERTLRGHGPGPVEAITFGGAGGGYPEPEAFSVDKDWMPNVVLMAKSTYVWLDQLSKRYARPIDRLDQIPDEELDQLANWGITSLWLIGLWERSSTSKTIKRMMGNPEAEASAYSLFDYTIAWDLGGETAYKNLADRAWKRGIRLASDMVPNHVGMFSRWTIEHPDWFIQSAHPPFPSYTFNGPDLSPDGRISLNIEDGYWNKTDAAVVFRHHDHRSGQTRFIYHGNDGTSMPWNDTAQLNYLLPEVREAVVQTILHVARMFPVIRFDAAMTLAKKHYQRLWFPKLGDAGAIPSRAEHGMSQEEFDRVFPVEFWREVVDRVAVEAPDTLLLAEAFWLMEGYFVRTLGMHRVYNSAFMNMLKMEDNEKFRLTVKNVLEYSPAILQRFVNFMNNPDEDTAEAQFGKGDKYFGVAMLLVTMPGLPMLGHGQVEGLTEKYGMEYRRAYRDEPIDMHLVRRHEREIFPLARRRYLFSGAEHFAFFDFVAPEGWANENVFAYTNRTLHERSLIIYNNAYAPASGTVRVSTAINEASAEEPRLRQRTLVEALGLDTASNCYYIYRDYRLGLDYIEHAQRLDEHGLSAQLHGYQYLALLDWRAVYDNDLSWAKLHGLLAGRGVPSIDDAYMEMVLAPILEPFRELVTAEHLTALYEAEESETFEAAFVLFVERCAEHCGVSVDVTLIRDEVEAGMEVVRAYAERVTTLDSPALRTRLLACDPELNPRVMTAYALLRPLGRIVHSADTDPATVSATSGAWMSEWYLARQLSRSFAEGGGDAWLAAMDARKVRAMVRGTAPLLALADNAWGPYLEQVFGDAETRVLMRVNNYGGHRWLHKESLADLLSAMLAAAYVESATYELTATAEEALMLALEDLDTMELAAEDVGFDFDWWLDALK